MTLEEAKDILLKLEQLVSKTNRMYKKGERMDSAPFLKLHRKRISMFEVQEEAECRELQRTIFSTIPGVWDNCNNNWHIMESHYLKILGC